VHVWVEGEVFNGCAAKAPSVIVVRSPFGEMRVEFEAAGLPVARATR
jgi:hypothetical protein